MRGEGEGEYGRGGGGVHGGGGGGGGVALCVRITATGVWRLVYKWDGMTIWLLTDSIPNMAHANMFGASTACNNV